MGPASRAPAGFDLRPRTLGELLDLTYRVFRSRFRVFAALGIGVALVNTAVGLVFNALMFGGTSFEPGRPPDFADMATLYGYMGLSMLIYMVVYSVGAMGITAATEATLLGEPITAKRAISQSLGRVPAAAVAGTLVGIAVGLGMLFCCLPAFPVGIALILTVPLVFLERKGPIQAMTRSHELIFKRGPVAFRVESNWLRVLVVGVVTLLIVYIVSIASSLPVLIATGIATLEGKAPAQTPLGPQFLGLHILVPLQLLSALIQGIFVSIAVIPWTLTYYDIRTRHEGLDLEREVLALAGEPAGAKLP
jgi:hypothetical protein